MQTPPRLKLAQSIVSEKNTFYRLPGSSLGNYQDFFNFFRLPEETTKEEVSMQI